MLQLTWSGPLLCKCHYLWEDCWLQFLITYYQIASSDVTNVSIVVFILPLTVAVDCGPLGNPVYGQVIFSSTTLGSTAEYSCNQGFLLSGVTIRTCQTNGLWSDAPPLCKSKQRYAFSNFLHQSLTKGFVATQKTLCLSSFMKTWHSSTFIIWPPRLSKHSPRSSINANHNKEWIINFYHTEYIIITRKAERKYEIVSTNCIMAERKHKIVSRNCIMAETKHEIVSKHKERTIRNAVKGGKATVVD